MASLSELGSSDLFSERVCVQLVLYSPYISYRIPQFNPVDLGCLFFVEYYTFDDSI